MKVKAILQVEYTISDKIEEREEIYGTPNPLECVVVDYQNGVADLVLGISEDIKLIGVIAEGMEY